MTQSWSITPFLIINQAFLTILVLDTDTDTTDTDTESYQRLPPTLMVTLSRIPVAVRVTGLLNTDTDAKTSFLPITECINSI